MAKMNIEIKCRECQEKTVIVVEDTDFFNWKAGQHAQRAFPYLTPGQRELLISQTCDACFDKIFEDLEAEVSGD